MRISIFLFILLFCPILSWGELRPHHSINGIDLLSSQKVDFQLNGTFKASVMVFVSARCPCSASHEIALSELFNTFSKQGFQFIGIHSNTDESIEITKSHFEKSAIPFSVIQDDRAKIADDWGALKTPHVFVVSPHGEILYQGGVDDSHSYRDSKKAYLREALLAIQEGKKPEIALTRSLGCVIKR